MYRTGKTALFQRGLPAWGWFFEHALRVFPQPLAHIVQLIDRAVGDCLHALPLAASTPVHAGRNDGVTTGKVVFRVKHLARVVCAQLATLQAGVPASQPQRGIHHVQIIIQQGKTQILGSYAIGAVFIHTDRSR
ncbi:hypothetical protein D3C75_871550 [compost metagenome]